MFNNSASDRRATNRGRHGHDPGPRSLAQRLLDRLVDIGLLGVIFVAPLAMGGRHPIGRFILVALVAVMAVSWFCRQCLTVDGRWRWTGAEWLVAAGAGVILVQLVSLPATVLACLSPHQSELLPLWNADGLPQVLGRWSRVSLTPSATLGGLILFVTYSTLFLVVAQRLRGIADVERLLRWIALGATSMAVIGLAQRFAGNGLFLWIYEHPFRDTMSVVKGTFINENHFAHFIALGIAPLLWWLHRDAQPDHGEPARVPRIAIGIALACVGVAGLLTFSRGGVVVMFLASAGCIGLQARAGLLRRETLLTLAGIGLFVAIALGIYGFAPLSDELATLGAGSVEEVDRFGVRRQLWAADLTAASKFPILGTGVGSHADISPVYFANRFDFEYTHAENGYLQVLLETGLIGLALLAVGIFLACRWGCAALSRHQPARVKGVAVVVVTTLLISLFHSLWDFVWYLPACMSLTILLLACGCRLYQLSPQSDSGRPRGTARLRPTRPAWGVATALVSLLAVAMVRDRLAPALAAPHWDQYLRQVAALQEADSATAGETHVDSLIASLQGTIDHDPRAERAHGRIANLLMREFERRQAEAVNPIHLAQLRRDALSSGFPSRQAQDAWMAVAIGDNRRLLYRALEHTRLALAQCPLHGETYIDLAALAFLEGRGDDAAGALRSQAVRVRPYSDDVMLAVGAQLAGTGDVAQALQHWKGPFQRSQPHRRQIIALIADELPPSELLRELEPTVDGLGDLFEFHRQLGQRVLASEYGWHYAVALEAAAAATSGGEAAGHWLAAYKVRLYLDDRQGALRCISNAVKATPTHYQSHLKLATHLIECEAYGAALEELNWCLRRNPQDQVAINCLRRARLSQLRQASEINPTAGERH